MKASTYQISHFGVTSKTLFKMLSLAISLLASAILFSPSTSIQIPGSPLGGGHTGRPLNVLPLPTKYTTGNQIICLSPDFSIILETHSGHEIPHDLNKAVQRTQDGIWANKHRYLSIERGAEFFTEGKGCDHTLSTLRVIVEQEGHMDSIMDSAIRPAEERPDLEAYIISVPLGSQATVTSKTALGAFRGLTTFENLFYHLPALDGESSETSKSGILSEPDIVSQTEQLPLGSGGQTDQTTDFDGAESKGETKGKWYAPAAPYEIEDKPAFGWRAVMLDTSRNWFGKEAILKVCKPLVCHR
jgi:hexosaminidase